MTRLWRCILILSVCVCSCKTPSEIAEEKSVEDATTSTFPIILIGTISFYNCTNPKLPAADDETQVVRGDCVFALQQQDGRIIGFLTRDAADFEATVEKLKMLSGQNIQVQATGPIPDYQQTYFDMLIRPLPPKIGPNHLDNAYTFDGVVTSLR